jgi:hypothetical protein
MTIGFGGLIELLSYPGLVLLGIFSASSNLIDQIGGV